MRLRPPSCALLVLLLGPACASSPGASGEAGDAGPGGDGGGGTEDGATSGSDAAPAPDATGGASPDGAAASDYPRLGPQPEPPAPYWRLDLQQASGAITLLRTTLLPAREGVPSPVPAHRGELLAVGRAGAEVVEVVPVRFASVMVEEGEEEDGTRWSETSSAAATRTSVFLRADEGADTFALIDRTGATVLTGPLRASARVADELSAELPYAVLLTDDSDKPLLPERLARRVVTIVRPGETDRASLLAAFRKVNPAARGAIHVVALVRMENDGTRTLPSGKRVVTLGVAFGNAMILNATFLTRPGLEDELIGTVVHEGAHNFHFLVDDLAADGSNQPLATWLEGWPEAYRAGVQATLSRRLVGESLSDFWIDLHASAVGAQIAINYTGAAWASTSDADAIAGGFASSYGSTNVFEDVAEYTQAIQSDGPSSALCTDLAAKGQIDATRALNWAKAHILVGLGLIGDAELAACIGSTRVQAEVGARVGSKVFDRAGEFRVRATTDFTELNDPAPRDRCSGRALCGRFAPAPLTSAMTLEAHSKYGPFGWGGQVPPGWMPGSPLIYSYFQIGLVITPGAPLVGVHRVTRRDESPLVGGRLMPIANVLYADSPSYDVFLGSDSSGLLIISRADPDRVEGVMTFLNLLHLADADDPRNGRLAQIVPLTTFRIDSPPNPDDPCCDQ